MPKQTCKVSLSILFFIDPFVLPSKLIVSTCWVLWCPLVSFGVLWCPLLSFCAPICAPVCAPVCAPLLQVEWKCRAKAYEYYRMGCERMIALVAGRPLSSSLEDGTGALFGESVVELRRIEQLVSGCDWWVAQKKKQHSPNSRNSPNNRNNRNNRGSGATATTNKKKPSLEYPSTSIHTALRDLHRLMQELVTMEKCASTLQR